jgi:hypothetical protein
MKTNLKLSDAIRLGSLLVPRREAGNVERCAITMALKAIGALPADLDDCRSYAYSEGWNQWNTLACPERTLREAYPWLTGDFRCYWCPRQLSGEEVVWHPFDDHVMCGLYITIEAFCGWIDEIEAGEVAGTDGREQARCYHSAA